jgi:penicillin-binding protein 1C
MLRAVGQLVRHGRIVSGGSTITMQVARLLEPRPRRTLTDKLVQMARALQLERRYSKEQILEFYLTLAPYGGNLEGIRAASLAYFEKEPAGLALEEAALLVALPQSPESRRPDRYPERAREASLRVIERATGSGLIAPGETERVAGLGFRAEKHPLPQFAPHLADRAVAAFPEETRIATTLRRPVQQRLEKLARDSAIRLGPGLSVAIVMADSYDGSIIADVGSADMFDASRSGWVDMTTAKRSPGSTLKPFIYGLAFQEGLVLPETMIADRPADFSGYRPQNFDMHYQGDVTVRRALQMSLNVPAVRLLHAVGPYRLAALLRRGGAEYELAGNGKPGLSIGLGGLGLSLTDLVQLYAGLASGTRGPVALSNGVDPVDVLPAGTPFLQPAAIWHVTDILRGVLPPAGSPRLDIAYKTGTSYGYRDAWSVGYDGRYVIGVWVGRADNGATPGLTGINGAAPVLFEAFGRSGLDMVPFPSAPAGAVRIAREDLPASLRRFEDFEETLAGSASGEPAPHIAYPPTGARVALGVGGADDYMPLVVKLQGGRPPFRWLANGRPLPQSGRRRTLTWMPDGPGSADILVIDAAGRTARVDVFVE